MTPELQAKLNENLIHQYTVYWCKVNVQISGDTALANIKNNVHKMRPVVVLSKDIANATANIVTVAPMTTVVSKTKIPQHVLVASKGEEKTTILVEQIMTVKKNLILPKAVYTLSKEEIKEVKTAIADLLMGGSWYYREID